MKRLAVPFSRRLFNIRGLLEFIDGASERVSHEEPAYLSRCIRLPGPEDFHPGFWNTRRNRGSSLGFAILSHAFPRLLLSIRPFPIIQPRLNFHLSLTQFLLRHLPDFF